MPELAEEIAKAVQFAQDAALPAEKELLSDVE